MKQGVRFSCAINKKISRNWLIFCFGDPAGARTQDPNIKSVVLYLLSYRVILFAGAKVRLFSLSCRFSSNFFSFVKPTFALSGYNNLIISAIHDGAFFVFTRASIDDNVHQVLVTVVNLFWVGEVGVDFVLFIRQ